MAPSSVYKLILGIGLLVFMVGGCGKEEEPWTPPSPAVVRKKVSPKKVVTVEPAPAETPTALPAEAQPPLPPEAEQKPLEAGVEPLETEKPAVTPEDLARQLASLYDPAGKPDPFVPPSSRLQPSELAKKSVREHKLPLTPLQKVDLSQLKLVGIIVSASGNKALIEDPAGKGYVITRGTYVGMNFGRVKNILPDRVIVEEEVEDFFSGEMRLQTSELILQKKLGEI